MLSSYLHHCQTRWLDFRSHLGCEPSNSKISFSQRSSFSFKMHFIAAFIRMNFDYFGEYRQCFCSWTQLSSGNLNCGFQYLANRYITSLNCCCFHEVDFGLALGFRLYSNPRMLCYDAHFSYYCAATNFAYLAYPYCLYGESVMGSFHVYCAFLATYLLHKNSFAT